MKRNVNMLGGSLYTGIISYTVPVMLTGVLQLLFNAADLVIVGRFCGSNFVGAVGATSAIINLIVNLFIGLSNGTGVTVAHALGAGDNEDAHKTVHTALPTALVSGAALTLVGVLFAEDFLIWMKTPEETLPLSTLYMQIYFGGIVFSMIYNFCSSILRAAGDTKTPLLYLTIAGIINVPLNIFFITVCHMDVDGVALATIISQAISAALVVIALMRRSDACRLYLRKIRFYKTQLLKIIRIGLPAGIQGTTFSISNVIIQSSVNSFNSQAILDGNSAAISLEGFVLTMMNSFHQAAINFVGQNVGAHQFKRVKKTFAICLGYVTIVGLVAGVGMWYFGEELLSLYISDSPDAIAVGVTRMGFIALPYFVCGLMDVTTGTLRGLGSSFVPMLISIAGVCGIRIIWIYTIFQMPAYHTLESLYISYLISWVITFLAELAAFVIIYRRRVKVYQT